MKLKLTRLKELNDTLVIKQEGGKFFIASPNSFIIDKNGLIILLLELIKVGYFQVNEIESLYDYVLGWNKEKEYAQNEEDSSDSDSG